MTTSVHVSYHHMCSEIVILFNFEIIKHPHKIYQNPYIKAFPLLEQLSGARVIFYVVNK